MKKGVVLIGYSGHAFVVCDIVQKNNDGLLGYCEINEKEVNPYNLDYLGSELGFDFSGTLAFIAIGDNILRQKIQSALQADYYTALHPSAIIGGLAQLGVGTMVGPGAVVNALVEIEDFAIVNSGAIIEHECRISSFAHIGPGAVLAGGVTVGSRSFIGANSVVREGISIGSDVVIGAGSVIIRDVPNGQVVVGNPGRIINHKKT